VTCKILGKSLRGVCDSLTDAAPALPAQDKHAHTHAHTHKERKRHTPFFIICHPKNTVSVPHNNRPGAAVSACKSNKHQLQSTAHPSLRQARQKKRCSQKLTAAFADVRENKFPPPGFLSGDVGRRITGHMEIRMIHKAERVYARMMDEV
jgi:hypothetical protein